MTKNLLFKMSHFTTVQTQFKDKECLVEALKTFFQEVENHNTAENLFGYRGDQRPQTAEVIIRRQFVGKLSNDIGFWYNRVDNCYNAYISEYDQKQLKYNDQWLNKVKVEYSQKAIEKQARKIGAGVEKVRMADGSVQYRIKTKAKQNKKFTQFQTNK